MKNVADTHPEALANGFDEIIPSDLPGAFRKSLVESIGETLEKIQSQINVQIRFGLANEIIKDVRIRSDRINDQIQFQLNFLEHLIANELTGSGKSEVLVKLGKTYDLLGRWEDARDALNEALECCDRGTHTEAEALMRLGHIMSKRSDYDAANSLYERSAELLERLGDYDMLINVRLCLGYNLFELGNYEEAERIYVSALDASDSRNLPESSAQTRLALGILHAARNDLETAKRYLLDAVARYESLGDYHGLAATYHNLGIVQTLRCEYRKAGESYCKSVAYAEKVGNIELVELVTLNRIHLALKTSNYDIAESCCRYALRSFSRMQSLPRVAEAYRILGKLMHRKKEWRKSERAFKRSIDIFMDVGQIVNAAEARCDYALMLKSIGNESLANEQSAMALEVFRSRHMDAVADDFVKALESCETDIDPCKLDILPMSGLQHEYSA